MVCGGPRPGTARPRVIRPETLQDIIMRATHSPVLIEPWSTLLILPSPLHSTSPLFPARQAPPPPPPHSNAPSCTPSPPRPLVPRPSFLSLEKNPPTSILIPYIFPDFPRLIFLFKTPFLVQSLLNELVSGDKAIKVLQSTSLGAPR